MQDAEAVLGVIRHWRARCGETRTAGSGGGRPEKDQPCWHLAGRPTPPIRGRLGQGGDEVTVASFIASQGAGYGVANVVAWRALDVSESWFLASGGIVARPGATSEQRRWTRR